MLLSVVGNLEIFRNILPSCSSLVSSVKPSGDSGGLNLLPCI